MRKILESIVADVLFVILSVCVCLRHLVLMEDPNRTFDDIKRYIEIWPKHWKKILCDIF